MKLLITLAAVVFLTVSANATAGNGKTYQHVEQHITSMSIKKPNQ